MDVTRQVNGMVRELFQAAQAITLTQTRARAHTHTHARQVNDMVRELFKQLKVLSDAHSVAQRKLDAILAGQHM